MPKRTGYLYEQFLTESNFILGERLMVKNKKKNRTARFISENAELFGKELFIKYKTGQFKFGKPRERIIKEGYKGKERHLKIPSLEDQAVQQAWLNIAQPYIERKNYYYNCGSIPKAGQSRCFHGLRKALKRPTVRYGAVTDIRKFYDTCPHSAVTAGLRKIFKDERFVRIAQDILDSMSDTGEGIAIGFPVSHWFANVALSHIDNELMRQYPSVFYTRFMDDSAFVGTNKRQLCRCVHQYKSELEQVGLRLKFWQVYPVTQGIPYLSYRFFQGYTLLKKPLMKRISRRFRHAEGNMTIHTARGLVSYKGILKPCNSFNFKIKHIYPYFNFKTLERIISDYDKNLLRNRAFGS